MIAAAQAVGVRTSSPPLRASTGTSGNGCETRLVPAAGVGRPRQVDALPSRSVNAAPGCHGNVPSWQTVAR
jgi:hypothetical protein